MAGQVFNQGKGAAGGKGVDLFGQLKIIDGISQLVAGGGGAEIAMQGDINHEWPQALLLPGINANAAADLKLAQEKGIHRDLASSGEPLHSRPSGMGVCYQLSLCPALAAATGVASLSMDGIATLAIIVAYLLGSLSSALLVCRLFSLPDPRQQGSGNPGATNVFRLGGALPGGLTLLGDLLKGTIPVWGAYFLGVEPLWLGVVAIAACVGHMFPLYHGFRGGKAVATAFGALLPIGLDLGAMLVACWLLVLLLSGYSSLASIITLLLAPLLVWWLKPLYTLPVLMLALLMLLRHRSNMLRLLKGQEPKARDKGLRSR